MSSTEVNVGTLTPLGLTKEQYQESIAKNCRVQFTESYDAAAWLYDMANQFNHPVRALILNGMVYTVDWEVYAETDGYMKVAKKQPGGKIFFATQHYNGGASIEEVLEDLV